MPKKGCAMPESERLRRSEGMKRFRDTEEGRAAHARSVVASHTPEAIEKMLDTRKNPEWSVNKGNELASRWSDPEAKAKLMAGRSDPDAARRRNEKVAAYWNDPKVAAARAKKSGVRVMVDGTTNEYASVRAAFDAFVLPLGVHQKFRTKLKKSPTRRETFTWEGREYLFQVLD